MSSFKSTQLSHRVRSHGAAIESLEGRAYMSSTPAAVTVTVPGPILETIIAGTKINDKISVNIANNDLVKASGRVTIALFASQENTLGSDAAQLQTATSAGISIIPGHNHTYKINVKSFPENLSGSYYILAEVSGTGVDETVGSSVEQATISPPNIDLINTITKAPSTAHAGHKIPVTLEVANDGNVPAKGPLAVAFSLSATSDGSSPATVGTLSTHISIKAGMTKVLHFSVPMPLGVTTGNQYLVAEVDPLDTYLESNLDNNLNVFQTAISIT